MQVAKPYCVYFEAELTAKKGGSIAHQLQRVGKQERTEMPSSPFFDVLISFASSTFLI